MIRATIEEIRHSARPDKAAKWHAWAEWGGQRYDAISRSGASNALCRVLVDAGAPDGPLEVRGIDGKARFTVASVHAAARYTYAESASKRLSLVRYKALNHGDVWPKVGVSPAAGYPHSPEASRPSLPSSTSVHVEAAE